MLSVVDGNIDEHTKMNVVHVTIPISVNDFLSPKDFTENYSLPNFP